jgi:hypothetical protein
MDEVAVPSGRFIQVFHQGEQRGLLPGGELLADRAPAARFFGCVCHGLNGRDRTGLKAGNNSGGTIRVMLRACPGTRRIKPRLSSVSTIECTLGGVI